MFTPIYQLSLYNPDEKIKYRDRWEPIYGGGDARKFVLEKIREGAGEDFLQLEFERQNGVLHNILDDMYDLRGLVIVGEEIDFPLEDNFEAIDFSYSTFSNNIFKNAYFRCSFNFTKFYGCTFKNCTFHNSDWLGSKFEECEFINCDFIERCKFNNCSFSSTIFTNYFTQNLLFNNCKFDATFKIEKPNLRPVIKNWTSDVIFENKKMADFYSSLEEGYKAGNVTDKKREYHFEARKMKTRYNNDGILDSLHKYIIEFLTGYGTKPFRAFNIGISVLIIFSGVYNIHLNNFSEALFISARAFFTLGDFPETFNRIYKIIYLFEGILGWFVLALYLTTLVNIWFSEN